MHPFILPLFAGLGNTWYNRYRCYYHVQIAQSVWHIMETPICLRGMIGIADKTDKVGLPIRPAEQGKRRNMRTTCFIVVALVES